LIHRRCFSGSRETTSWSSLRGIAAYQTVPWSRRHSDHSRYSRAPQNLIAHPSAKAATIRSGSAIRIHAQESRLSGLEDTGACDGIVPVGAVRVGAFQWVCSCSSLRCECLRSSLRSGTQTRYTNDVRLGRQLGVEFGQEVDGPTLGGWATDSPTIRSQATLRRYTPRRTLAFNLSAPLPHAHHRKPKPFLPGEPREDRVGEPHRHPEGVQCRATPG
jgi:hypothetical protein